MHVTILICALFSIALARTDTPDIVVITPKSMANVLRIKHKCEIETNPPPDVMKNMPRGVYNNEAELHFIYCYLTGAGYAMEDGHFAIPKLISIVKEDYPKREQLEKVFNDCNKLLGKDPINTMRLLLDCFRENTPVVFTL